MKTILIIVITLVFLFVPNDVSASHEPPSPLDSDQIAYNVGYYGIPALFVGIPVMIFFLIRKKIMNKRKEKQRDNDIQKLKDKVEELEKDKERKD